MLVFGADRARNIVLRNICSLNVPPEHWRRTLCIMAARGVEDPEAVMAANPALLHLDHAAPSFLERSLLLERHFPLTPAQLYKQHAHCLRNGTPEDIALRLLYVRRHDNQCLLVASKQLERRLWAERQRALPADQRCLLPPQWISLSDIIHGDRFHAAAGVTAEQLGQFAAEHPTNPRRESEQAGARQELQRLDAVMPPRPAKQRHSRQRAAAGAAP